VTPRPRPTAAARRRALVGPVLLGALALVVLAVAVLRAGPAASQESASLVLRKVDAVDPSNATVQFIFTGEDGDVPSAQLVENGITPDASAPRPLPADTPMSTALVFDTAAAMDDSGALLEAKDAAKAWVRSRTGDDAAFQAFAVFVASDAGMQLQDFTTDTERLVSAIDRVAPPSTAEGREQSALWSAVRQAADGLAERSGTQPNLVIMTGTNDNVSGRDRTVATGAVTSSGATVFAAQLANEGYSSGPVDGLVATNGGLSFSTSDGTGFGGLVDTIAEAVEDEQYVMPFESAVGIGTVADLGLTVGESTANASVVIGSSVQGKVALNPEIIEAGGGVTFLQGNLGLILMVLVVLLAVGLLAYGIVMIFFREDRLKAVLEPYEATVLGAQVADDRDNDDVNTSLARTAIVQRAVELTEQVAQDRGLLVKVEHSLERANLPLRAGEALFFYLVVVVVLTLLALIVTGNLIIGLIVGVFAAMVPAATVNFLAARRRKQFMALLPDTLSLLSGTLRAGYSLMQGVEAVSQEVAEPMGQELRRVVTEARLGRPLEEALDGTSERMASPDFAWAVMAIRIQREVGGNLAELLLTVADTMVQRERLRRDVQALTAEGRVSAMVLGILPIGLGAVMFVMNPDYAGKLLNDGLGNVLLGLAVVSMLIGFVWMKKIIDIEI
jgi:tight adherence protein B